MLYSRQFTFELISYSYANYVGCKLDKKSVSGSCKFLGSNLVSWFSKKQNRVTLSTAEAEYISVGSCCAQLLWIKQQLKDYDIDLKEISLKCDNNNAINLSKNPILHSRSKHIEVRHHFLRDRVQNKDINLDFVSTNDQLADIFIKPLREERFRDLRSELEIYDPYL